jgi:hypothetical protein
MPSVQYKLFFGNKAASRKDLDRVEEVTVEQEQDVGWGASLKIPLCTDDKGNWSADDEKFMASFSRLRVEIQVGDGDFVALIDGPIVGADNTLSGEPGRSFITLRVQDDSAYLNRKDSLLKFDNMLDHEIAEQLFGQVEQIAETDVETTPAPPNTTPSVVQRGTEMKLLRTLAARQGMHAFVLPGSNPGESVGCFKKLPTTVSKLPDLILIGKDRNVESFTTVDDAQSPAKLSATAVNAKEKSQKTESASPSDLDPVGKKDVTLVKEDDVAVHVAPPRHSDNVDLVEFVKSLVEQYAFGLTATGQILGQCYSGVLSPYQYVVVRGVNSKLSGEYLITKVTHSLTRAEYGQSFTMKRKAFSDGDSGALGVIADIASSIF